MSTTEPLEAVAEPWDAKDPSAPRIYAERTPEPIVQSGSIAGRSLTAVVAIMTFLAALTTGAVMMVVSAANDWQSDVGREITIQVRPVPGRDIEADVRAAVDIARGTAGIADVRAYTSEADVTGAYATMCRDNKAFANFNKIGFDASGSPDPEDLHLAWMAGARAFRLTPR